MYGSEKVKKALRLHEIVTPQQIVATTVESGNS